MSLSVRCIMNEISDTIMHAAASASVGALCARAFCIMPTVHGAVFCGVSSVISSLLRPIFNAIFVGSDPDKASDSSVVLGTLVSVISGSALAAAVATRLGYPVTLAAGMTLTGAIFGAAVVAAVAIKLLGVCLTRDSLPQPTQAAPG